MQKINVKRILILISSLSFITNTLFSQSDTAVYKFVDKMPIFQDSIHSNSFPKYLLNNIDLSNVESNFFSGGRVILEYCIDTIGYTTDIKITRGISPKVDSAIKRAVKNSPRWVPGKLEGKPVKVSFTLPIDIHPQQ